LDFDVLDLDPLPFEADPLLLLCGYLVEDLPLLADFLPLFSPPLETDCGFLFSLSFPDLTCFDFSI
jgi:hypothetical protein